MSTANFAALLRELAREYFNQQLSTPDYRARRKLILDEVDRAYNRTKLEEGVLSPDAEQLPLMGNVVFSVNDNEDPDQDDRVP